jgi:opacity protein-like surface antigen
MKDFKMRSLKLALLATAATAVLSSATLAADLIVDVPVEPIIDNSFAFDGAYVGALLLGQTVPNTFGLGVNFGVNALMDSVLLGAEFEATASLGGQASAQATGRVGGLITDTAIAYVYSGFGARTGTSWYVPIGVGAEFAVADNVGLKAEAQYNWDLSGGPNSVVGKVGINFHF